MFRKAKEIDKELKKIHIEREMKRKAEVKKIREHFEPKLDMIYDEILNRTKRCGESTSNHHTLEELFGSTDILLIKEALESDFEYYNLTLWVNELVDKNTIRKNYMIGYGNYKNLLFYYPLMGYMGYLG